MQTSALHFRALCCLPENEFQALCWITKRAANHVLIAVELLLHKFLFSFFMTLLFKEKVSYNCSCYFFKGRVDQENILRKEECRVRMVIGIALKLWFVVTLGK